MNKPHDPLVPEVHSQEFCDLVDLMLQKDFDNRPQITEILEHPHVIAKRAEYGL